MTIYQFISILRARWFVACVIFCAVVVALIGLLFFLPKRYTATASIVVDSKVDPVAAGAGLSEVVMASYINTQSDVITSERVAKKVVKAVGLDRMPDFKEGWLKRTQGEGDIVTWLARNLLSGKKVSAGPPVNAS